MCSTWWTATPGMMLIGSEIEAGVVQTSAPIPYTGPDGWAHVLSGKELDSVEITGRCRWQDYAATRSPWTGTDMVEAAALAGGRPKAVEPGMRPVQKPDFLGVQSPSKIAHWSGCRCAATVGVKRHVRVLNNKEFGEYLFKCSRCFKAFLNN
jgi:hypothetical protein